jgi:3-hydroxyisobutyrate dehydrogenase-like beta-hydroxyacid dehydrogenase
MKPYLGEGAALARYGVRAAATSEDAVRHADVVICMLSSGPVCDVALFGDAAPEGGVIELMAPGATLVVMSSIPVEAARAQSARTRETGIAYLDAPVSGGEKGARDGTLAIMAGGESQVVDALAAIFAALGRVTHVGPS